MGFFFCLSPEGRHPTARTGMSGVEPSPTLDKTENEKTKQTLSRLAALDLGTAELAIQLDDHLMALNNLKKDKQIKALKESIKKALQDGETEKANRLTKEFERLKRA